MKHSVWSKLAGQCRPGFILLVAALFIAAPAALGQGCIIAHSFGEVGGPTTQGGYLQPGHSQLTVGYRHQYSFRHFVGSTEQVYRTQTNTAVRNRINLFTADLTYQVTRHWSVDFNLPLEFASRRYTIPAHSLGSFPATTVLGDYGISGFGDISLTAQRWMWDPASNPKHNIQLGIGLEVPTGQDDIQNNLISNPGAAASYQTADYSIQPGIGVWGIPFSWTSFQTLNSQVQIYFNGSYLATLQQSNGVLNGTLGSKPPQEQYVSPGDEYLMQAGISYSIASIKGLTLTFGPRDEGVVAHDLLSGNEGWRRPGLAVSLEPGFEYVFHGGHDMLQASVARAVYRNRTRSVPDTQLGTHGDAAFADYVWLASFVHRF